MLSRIIKQLRFLTAVLARSSKDGGFVLANAGLTVDINDGLNFVVSWVPQRALKPSE